MAPEQNGKTDVTTIQEFEQKLTVTLAASAPAAAYEGGFQEAWSLLKQDMPQAAAEVREEAYSGMLEAGFHTPLLLVCLREAVRLVIYGEFVEAEDWLDRCQEIRRVYVPYVDISPIKEVRQYIKALQQLTA